MMHGPTNVKKDFIHLLCYCCIFTKTKFFENRTFIICCDTGTSCEYHHLQVCAMYVIGAVFCHRVYEKLSGDLGVESLWWTHAATMVISLMNCFFFCRLKQVIIVCTFENVIAITSVYLKFKKVEKLHYLHGQCINFANI